MQLADKAAAFFRLAEIETYSEERGFGRSRLLDTGDLFYFNLNCYRQLLLGVLTVEYAAVATLPERLPIAGDVIVADVCRLPRGMAASRWSYYSLLLELRSKDRCYVED